MPEDPALIIAPAHYITPNAVAFGQIGGTTTLVDAAHPLPTSQTIAASGATPLTGTSSVSATAGPFAPVLGRAINLTLSGSWSGTVQLLRSIDGGATKLPLTVGGQPWALFAANCNEAVAEESEAGATYYLAATLSGGTLTYRVAQ